MFHYIYKITNKINNKYYIGRHSTKKLKDYYFGSGIGINNAVKKYGKKNNWNHNTLSWKKSFGKLISRGKLKGFQVNIIKHPKING